LCAITSRSTTRQGVGGFSSARKRAIFGVIPGSHYKSGWLHRGEAAVAGPVVPNPSEVPFESLSRGCPRQRGAPVLQEDA
jgi:hypothetical protein